LIDLGVIGELVFIAALSRRRKRGREGENILVFLRSMRALANLRSLRGIVFASSEFALRGLFRL
jgi:hypothetical protein